MDTLSLREIINKLDIKQGRPLMISSDIIRFWAEYRKVNRAFQPGDLIKSLQEKVTEKGTLIFPTYCWDFCSKLYYDYNKSLPHTGGLGRVALSMNGFKRTQHPIYSFAIWGKDTEKLCLMTNKSSFGKDSPFGYFNQEAVDHLMIGIPFIKGYTFVHYIEESVGVPYRYIKDFTGRYIDGQGIESIRTYSMYVRDLDIELRQIDSVENLLNQCVRQRLEFYGVEFRLINYAESYPVIEKDIVENRSRNLYVYRGQD